MNAFDERLALVEQRRQMMQMLAISAGGLIMAGFGLATYIIDHGHSRFSLGWVALGVAVGVGGQLNFLRQIMRNKDKGMT
ncbi:MAG TPA: hypothetical protein VL358_07785 [Caulobacteraceae bacterium]|jgi:hypothetical protein|nr:hypothetical protein [Caulobacteraceae bacterium]